MTTQRAGGLPPNPPPDPHDLVRDWATLWDSEFAALAVDREWQDWAGTLRPARADDPSGRPGAEPSSGATAAAAAPDARDDAWAEIRRLGSRVAELERRLAELDGSGGRSRDASGNASRDGAAAAPGDGS